MALIIPVVAVVWREIQNRITICSKATEEVFSKTQIQFHLYSYRSKFLEKKELKRIMDKIGWNATYANLKNLLRFLNTLMYYKTII